MNIFDAPDHPDIDRAFHQDGYLILRSALSFSHVTMLRESIDTKIEICSRQLGCSKEDYLSAVSRWVDPSIVTSSVTPKILESLNGTAQAFVKKPVQLKKMNIICKNAHCTGSIAYHQDISYSPQDPYQFSMWIALNDVSTEMAPLEVIPGSHLQPLKPPVDFWSPQYKPDPALQLRAEKLPINAGDAIFFDSRLWHGSDENKILASRYALVTRWESEGWSFDQPIPPIEPDYFGMWTSGQVTEEILSRGLSELFNKTASDFVELIDTWMELIEQEPSPFVKDKKLTLETFKNLKILHLAHSHHNGGDATGHIYKTLWATILCHLEEYMVNIEEKRSIG